MAENNICKEHSGCIARIENLEKESAEQWKGLEMTSKRIDSMLTKINVILGGVVVACIMLAINLLIK